MQSVNKVFLIGHVGKEPETKATSTGGSLSSFSLATSSSWKDKTTGERKTQTEWHKIVCGIPTLCNVIQNYIKKGSHLCVVGSLRTREWMDKDGKARFTTEINLSELTLLDKKDTVYNAPTEERPTHHITKVNASPEIDNFKPMGIEIDDEIPF